MNIFATLGLFVWYAIVAIIMVVIVLMLARVVINQADFNPFSRPVMLVRRWTDPLVNPVRRPLVQFGFSPNLAPLVTILIAILLGYFALEFIGAVLGTIMGLIASAQKGAPVSLVGHLLYGLLAVYSLLIFMRIVFSWVVGPSNRVLHFLIRATEPIMGPFRRIIPPLGMFDISPIIVLLLLDLLKKAIAATLL
ncbi:MAG: YggT family protein [Acidobacteria bacterium]|nr:YggT family protein [Acidobacteriota bacterium]